MTSDRILMNPRPSGKTKVKGKKADNSIIDMLTFDPDAGTMTPNVPMVYGTRNYIINGLGDFSQRGDFSSSSAVVNTAYCIDRFFLVCTNVTANKQTFTTSQPSGSFGSSLRITASSSATGNMSINQLIENPKTLIGKTVTFSAWVKSNSANARLRMYWGSGGELLAQSFGHSGGGTWEKLSLTVSIPVGVTEPNLHLNTQITLYNSGNVAITSGQYVEATQVMLNEGPVAAPFERSGGTIGGELALCQRYYYRLDGTVTFTVGFGHTQTTNSGRWTVPLPITMRTTPAISGSTASVTAVYSGGSLAVSSLAIVTQTGSLAVIEGTATGISGCSTLYISGGYLHFSAEI
jgi:hypothetical protein